MPLKREGLKELPHIDILVPTYNRPEAIKTFVDEIQKQNYPYFTVYIIDDHGNKPIENLVPKNKHFVYKRLAKNQGQASARNVGIQMGVGEIIVSMDDDAFFLDDPDALDRTWRYFKKNENLACLMFDVVEPDKKYLSEINDLDDGDHIGFHITCACAYRRKHLEEIKGFNNFFHSGAEETDISFKFLKRNLKIQFSTKIKAFHDFRPDVRSKLWYRKYRKNTTRNDLYIVLIYYPFLRVLPYFFGKWFSHIWFSLRNDRYRLDATLFTIIAGFEAMLFSYKALQIRQPLLVSQFRNWLKIRS